MAKCIELINEVNPDHNGTDIYVLGGEKATPVLRIEHTAKNYFDQSIAEQHNAQGIPYVPDSDKSLYIKPPLGCLYETNVTAEKLAFSGKHTTKTKTKIDQKLFMPYLSWHGGYAGNHYQGSISLRGCKDGSKKRYYTFNTVPSISKESFEGTKYFDIISVTLPRVLNSFPSPVNIKSLNTPITLKGFNPKNGNLSDYYDMYGDICIKEENFRSNGLTFVFFVHNALHLNLDYLPDEYISRAVCHPITLQPDKSLSYAVSMLVIKTNVEIVLDDAPLIFIGKGLGLTNNISFNVHKVDLPR